MTVACPLSLYALAGIYCVMSVGDHAGESQRGVLDYCYLNFSQKFEERSGDMMKLTVVSKVVNRELIAANGTFLLKNSYQTST